MSDTIKRIKKVAAELLGVDESAIKDSSRFIEDLGAQSVQIVELIAGFEEEFEVELGEDAAISAKTVADAAKLVEAEL